jgi:hypothetical protein
MSKDVDTGFTMAELDRMIPARLADAREQRHRRSVRFDPARRVIDVAGYQLDLDEARNAAELLDWLVQISHKSDTNPQRLRDLFRELDEACQTVFGKGTQGVYCPWGEARVVDWRRGVTRPARVEAVRGTPQQPSEDGKKTARRGAKRRMRPKARR